MKKDKSYFSIAMMDICKLQTINRFIRFESGPSFEIRLNYIVANQVSIKFPGDVLVLI